MQLAGYCTHIQRATYTCAVGQNYLDLPTDVVDCSITIVFYVTSSGVCCKRLCALPSPYTGSFLNYTANMSASFNASSVRSSHKKPPHTIPTSAERILDAPSLVDDYCKPDCMSWCVFLGHTSYRLGKRGLS